MTFNTFKAIHNSTEHMITLSKKKAVSQINSTQTSLLTAACTHLALGNLISYQEGKLHNWIITMLTCGPSMTDYPETCWKPPETAVLFC